MGKTLVFAVFDFDRFTKNDEIGEVSKFKATMHICTIIISIQINRSGCLFAISTWLILRSGGKK